jgi:hypothetical protein
LTKGGRKAEPHIDDLIRFDGGYGQQRRTRKWAAFAFVKNPEPWNNDDSPLSSPAKADDPVTIDASIQNWRLR